MIVPWETLIAAAAEQLEPAAAAVVQLMIVAPAVHVVDDVDGFTATKAQVIEAPE
jgi:hypothetical protein